MAMFSTRMVKEKTQSDAISTKSVVAKPIDINENASATNANDIGTRLSKRATSHPETGSPISELMGIKSNMVPSSASLYPKKVLMVGMRDAQDEKHTPDMKKKTLKNNRCRFFNSMLPESAQK